MASFYKDDNPLVGGGQIDQLHHFKIKIFRTWFLQLLSWQSAIMPGDGESVFPGVIAFRENSWKKNWKTSLERITRVWIWSWSLNSSNQELDWYVLPSWTWQPTEKDNFMSWAEFIEYTWSDLLAVFGRRRPEGFGILPPEGRMRAVGVVAVKEPPRLEVKHDVSVDIVVFGVFPCGRVGLVGESISHLSSQPATCCHRRPNRVVLRWEDGANHGHVGSVTAKVSEWRQLLFLSVQEVPSKPETDLVLGLFKRR